jgi:hypothetical protein
MRIILKWILKDGRVWTILIWITLRAFVNIEMDLWIVD